MAKAGLTIKQKKVYDFIRMWIKEKGDSPSFEEIGQGLGIKSKSAVTGYLDKLQQRGYITRIPKASRSITIVTDEKTLPHTLEYILMPRVIGISNTPLIPNILIIKMFMHQRYYKRTVI